MTDIPERQLVSVGDTVARKYPWSADWLHATVEAEYLEDWQRVVDAGLWRMVRKAGET